MIAMWEVKECRSGGRRNHEQSADRELRGRDRAPGGRARGAAPSGFHVHDVFAPYPVHGLDEAMGSGARACPGLRSRAALRGWPRPLGFQFYTAVFDWPLNVGGKPDNSTLAFVPISFELTVLLGGLATAAAFFWRSGLGRRFQPRLVAPDVTDDALVLVVDLDDRREEAALRDLLRAAGAREVWEQAREEAAE